MAYWTGFWFLHSYLAGDFSDAVEMTQRKKYSLAVPHLAWAYNYLGEFKETNGQVTKTYGPWALIWPGWDAIFPKFTVLSLDKLTLRLTLSPVWNFDQGGMSRSLTALLVSRLDKMAASQLASPLKSPSLIMLPPPL